MNWTNWKTLEPTSTKMRKPAAVVARASDWGSATHVGLFAPMASFPRGSPGFLGGATAFPFLAFLAYNSDRLPGRHWGVSALQTHVPSCLVATARTGAATRTCEPRRCHCRWSTPLRTRRNACTRRARGPARTREECRAPRLMHCLEPSPSLVSSRRGLGVGEVAHLSPEGTRLRRLCRVEHGPRPGLEPGEQHRLVSRRRHSHLKGGVDGGEAATTAVP